MMTLVMMTTTTTTMDTMTDSRADLTCNQFNYSVARNHDNNVDDNDEDDDNNMMTESSC